MNDFSEALLCVKAGGSAYRQAWRGRGYQGVLRFADGDMFPLLYMESAERAERGAFHGGHADLLAEDWVLDWPPR